MIEVNPRSSRTVPYISKVTGIPIVPSGNAGDPGPEDLRELGYDTGTAEGSRLHRHQDAGVLLREDPRRRYQPGTGDEIHR